MFFDYFGSVDLLTSIVSGSLKQKAVLNQSVRLWVQLTSLYGSGERLNFDHNYDKWFTLADWRNKVKLFKPSATNSGEYHNFLLPDFKTITIEEWLFTGHGDKQKWQASFKDKHQISEINIDQLLTSSKCPFAVDQRTLSNDFNHLFERGWLERKVIKITKQTRKNSKTGQTQEVEKPVYGYKLVEDWLDLIPASVKNLPVQTESSEETFSNLISSFFDNFAQPINGQQRFFIDVEYVVPSRESEKIESLQQQLKQIWSQVPVPPLKLTYLSAKLFQEEVECIVYPVCFYYLLRAPYLFAYGQVPGNSSKIDWYDYRIDRIQEIEILDWEQDKSEIAPDLLQKFANNNLPNSSYVRNAIAEALGYDFYKPQQIMYVRFDRYFHANYIAGTERDYLFSQVTTKKLELEIKRANLEQSQEVQLLNKLNKNSADVYCQVPYYTDDNNVIMRLRAWGAKVEVILPWQLRQEMIQNLLEVQKSYQ